MSTRRSTAKSEIDVGSTLSKKPRKKKEINNNNDMEAGKQSSMTSCHERSSQSSTQTKRTKRKKDGTKNDPDDNNNNNNEEKDKEKERSNRNDSFSNEAKIAMKQFSYQIVQSGLHHLRVQYNELKAFVPADPSKKHFEANLTKCRYKDVPCWDKTRIVLSWPPGVPNDFVHANRISHELLEAQQFICCQGPLPDTVADMWRCLWQENVKQVIMLCCCQEMGKNKCAQYWPSTVGEKMTFHGLTIRCEKVDASDRSFVYTKLSLTLDGKTRTLDHRQWRTWPDKSVPKTPMAPFRLLQHTRKYPQNPTVIHCSAGVGRTGTLLMIEIMYRSLIKGKIPDVPQLVKDVRSQRSQAVQTEDQYLYCHYAILQLLHIKKIAPSHFIKHFIREYENYLKLLNDVGGKNLPLQATPLPQPCANCTKLAAHMNDVKPAGATAAADSPPSESRNEKKEESKRENGGAAAGKNDAERKANLLKQLKTQKEKKREQVPEQQQLPPQTPPSPVVEAVNQTCVTTEDVKAPESPLQQNNNNNVVQQGNEQKPVASQTPPSPIQPEENIQSSSPPPPSLPSPAAATKLSNEKFVEKKAPPPAAAAPPPQQPPQSQAQQQQNKQSAAASEPQQSVPPSQQQVPPQCPPSEPQQQQKFRYTPAHTYTIKQAGNEKVIVYHRNANQPFVKALASPAGTQQQVCLVQQPPNSPTPQPQPQQNPSNPAVEKKEQNPPPPNQSAAPPPQQQKI
uniref:Uncharacterized protein n=1 Tax=Panagrolaimus sp. ES5 TaxID=591445 RepID=A0AC34GN55_9BILA